MAHSTSNRRPSIFRGFVGFFIGGLPAAIAAAIIFLAFFPMSQNSEPGDRAGGALIALVLVTFLCGGVIGRKGFSADTWSDLLPPFAGCYVLIGLLCFLSTLDSHEKMLLVAFASAGMLTSAVVSLTFLCCFPPSPRD